MSLKYFVNVKIAMLSLVSIMKYFLSTQVTQSYRFLQIVGL